MSPLSEAAREVLEDGRLCYLAARTAAGIHLTPLVFVLDGGRIWATTSRSSTKARAWRRNPVTAGLVRHEGRAVTFRGKVAMYDALDPSTWGVSVVRAPALARASAKFALKNVLYFAGYARDVYRVPLVWTPPGRVMASVELEAGALLDLHAHRVLERWGDWDGQVRGVESFEPAPRGTLPEKGLPEELKELLGQKGHGTVAVEGPLGLAVLPGNWMRAPSEGAYYVTLPERFLALAGTGPGGPGSLVFDQASRWRAARMAGLLLRGEAEVFVPSVLRNGSKALLERARRSGPLPEDPTVVRLRPKSAVWWKGWSSGTVGRR